jgi:hypothetical protein
MVVSGPKGTKREISWPEKREDTNEEDVFVAIRRVLEESQNLNLTKESDRLVLAHQISKIFDKRKTNEDT